jgi:hypothetical protein
MRRKCWRGSGLGGGGDAGVSRGRRSKWEEGRGTRKRRSMADTWKRWRGKMGDMSRWRREKTADTWMWSTDGAAEVGGSREDEGREDGGARRRGE